jgi:hypothetical protein
VDFPGCAQFQPPRLGEIEVPKYEGACWTEGHARRLVIAPQGACANAAALNKGNILLLSRHLQDPDSGLRVIGVENTTLEGRAKSLTKTTTIAEIFNDMDFFHRALSLEKDRMKIFAAAPTAGAKTSSPLRIDDLIKNRRKMVS